MGFIPKGINRKILILTLSLVTGASMIIGLVALFVFYEHSFAKELDHDRELSRYLAEEISLFMNNALENNEQISSLLTMDDIAGEGNLMEKLCSGSGIFDAFSLVGIDGRVVKFYPANKEIIGENLSPRPWFKKAVETNASYVSEPYLAKTGNLIVVIASPVRDARGKIVGVLAGSIHLIKDNNLKSLVKSLRVGETGHAFIISEQGHYIYHRDPHRIMQKVFHNKAVSAVMQGQAGAVETNDREGKPVLAGFAPVPVLNWGVVVQVPAEEVLASAKNLRNILFFMIVAISIVVLVVTFSEVQRVIRPLKVLMHGVERVTKGDFAFEIAATSEDEIGWLTKSFNNMVGRIKSMREEIENKQRTLVEKNEELKVLATTDGLTRLYNHRYFQERIEEVIRDARNNNKNFALVLIDLDHFKYYNDLFGHQAGDKLLVKLSEVIKDCLSPQDFLARYGGEEFAVIMPDVTGEEAFKRAEFIRRSIEEYPFKGGSQQPNGRITVSIGLATYPLNAQTKEELFKRTDEALYNAKCFSRNKVEMYFSVLDELSEDLNKSDIELINSIKMLVRIINAKDKYTFGHSERVSRYAVAIAQRLKMPEEEIRFLKLGAFLHDIGKIEIDRGILTKKQELTKDEFEIIKKHPFWGAAIIKAVEALHPTLPVIKFHHERLDGSGYPHGLKGDEIPLAAKILAVADSFDAMTSNRPYRKSMTLHEAKDEIQRCAGLLFDQRIVKVFLSYLDDDF